MKVSDDALPKLLDALQRMFRIVARLLFLSLLAGGISGSQAETERDAQRHFQEKRYESALKIYRRLARENPDVPRFAYNAGASAYRAKDMKEAEKQFVNASHSPENLELQQKTHYNLGNTSFRLGETAANPEQKIAHWKKAVQRYQHALSLDETDQDAQENLDFVKHRLEELQQQQQNQEQQNNNNENQEPSEQQPTSNAETNSENSPPPNNEPQPSSEPATNQEQNKENQTQQNQANTENTAPETPQSSQSQSNEEEEKSSSGAASPTPGKMTPEQAKQLLDAERNQAKAMIFQPPQKRRPRNRSFKDW